MSGETVDGSARGVHLSASIMCGDLGALRDEVCRLEESGVDSLHVDVMDGNFVPNLTFGPDTVRMLREATRLPLHVHMMVTQPERLVAPFADAGADVYLFHVEAEPFPGRLSNQIVNSGMVPGVAINPFTPVGPAADLALPYVLVMSVEPGFAGQKWIATTERRVGELREAVGSASVIGIDGNVNLEHAAGARDQGATLFVCGTSSLFGRPNYHAAVDEFRTRLMASAGVR
ncbi:MAG: ribulose phosphate epimerase [Acidimicrobiaceae bacterium]|nr:ribulose phosphate epimerase [Acidimicrobiaceae bacterium]